jgi:hypothetical protein
MFTRLAQRTRDSSRSISFSSWKCRSSSRVSHLLIAMTRARPASTTWLITRWSCSLITSSAASRTTATSAAWIAASVRRLA